MKIFVYGSLMRGMVNHYVLEHCDGKFISYAATEADSFVLYNDWNSPWLAIEAHGTKLHGEVWEVARGNFPIIDDFENECCRIPIKVNSEDGQPGSMSVYIYVPKELPPTNLERLPVRDWRTFVQASFPSN